jgi:hypothetical protein
VDRRIRPSGTRPTPGRFATRVVTRGIDPHLQIHYKASKVKASFKEQRALRVETTINDPGDFGVGRRLSGDNWRAPKPSVSRPTLASWPRSARVHPPRPTRPP